MMKIWDRAEQTLVGLLGLAALVFALWQILSRYLFPRESIGYAEEVVADGLGSHDRVEPAGPHR
jgi:TRAP-type C4-dicarboxylate transport system permease small subunit